MKKLYFRWLIRKIKKYKKNEYMFLLLRLFDKKFYSLIRNDDNRIGDGLYLRYIFCHDYDIDYNQLNIELGECTVLEVLIALSKRGSLLVSYENTKMRFYDIFWFMIKNIGFDLNQYNDENISKIEEPLNKIDYFLNRFLDRKYNRFGENGAIFSVLDSKNNFKRMELWEQFNEGIMKNLLKI